MGVVVCPICHKYVCECEMNAVDKQSAYVAVGGKGDNLERGWYIPYDIVVDDCEEVVD